MVKTLLSLLQKKTFQIAIKYYIRIYHITVFNISLTFKKFENKELNVSIDTHIDEKHNTWFKGKDVAEALGYKLPRKAILDHTDEEDKTEYKDL